MTTQTAEPRYFPVRIIGMVGFIGYANNKQDAHRLASEQLNLNQVSCEYTYFDAATLCWVAMPHEHDLD